MGAMAEPERRHPRWRARLRMVARAQRLEEARAGALQSARAGHRDIAGRATPV